MSFILDALRKSEHDRQRQTGPALAEVAVAAPKSRSNVWAPVAIALLLVNLVVIGVLLVRKAVQAPVATTPSVQEPVSTPLTAPPPSAAMAAPPATVPPAVPTGSTGVQARNPLEAETTDGTPVLDPLMAAHAATPPPGPPAVTRTPASRGSVVYESLPDSAVVGGPPPGSVPRSGQATAARPASGAGLASADELTASGSVPALNLDLHVYSTTPTERLVFINSHKYREGDTLPEGPQVRQITTNGVILTYDGRDYLLTSN